MTKKLNSEKKETNIKQKRPSMPPPQYIQTTKMTPLVKVGMKKNSVVASTNQYSSNIDQSMKSAS
jgi:hypothetical protein